MLLIDRPAWFWRGRLWSHLISDTSLDELHDFARAAGLRYASFGLDHYDVPEELHEHVIALGANEADARELVRRLRDAGLRQQRGKQLRSWRRGSIDDAGLGAEVSAAAHALGVSASSDRYHVIERPGTTLVMFEFDADHLEISPNLAGTLGAVAPSARPVLTRTPDGLIVVELVFGNY